MRKLGASLVAMQRNRRGSFGRRPRPAARELRAAITASKGELHAATTSGKEAGGRLGGRTEEHPPAKQRGKGRIVAGEAGGGNVDKHERAARCREGTSIGKKDKKSRGLPTHPWEKGLGEEK